MIVLTRQKGESVMIGDDVEVIIVDVRGAKVRLGITAPKHIPIHRKEIYDAIPIEKDSLLTNKSGDEVSIIGDEVPSLLVLSRERGESIMIGDDVEVIIVDVRGDKVRLGITAPKYIPIHRKEIYDSIVREKSSIDSVIELKSDVKSRRKKAKLSIEDSLPSWESVCSLKLLIDPGDSTAEEIGELFFELSNLYRMVGGSGINFRIVDTREASIA